LRKAGLGMAEVEAALAAFNANRCRPPLDAREVVAIARSAGRYKVESRLTQQVTDYPCTDDGNAALMRDLFGSRLRFDHSEGRWYIWAGKLWRPDRTRSIFRAAVKAAAWRAEQAYSAPGLTDLQRGQHFAWARASQNVGKIEAACKLLACDSASSTVSGQWDTEARYLGVGRGLVDLCTGRQVEPRPEMLVRFHTQVSWKPGVDAPAWGAFLEQTLGQHEGLPQFVQRAVGYSLAGQPVEQVWFLLHGKGANGKSVFLRVLREVFGEHAAVIPFTCLEARNTATVPNDLARLVGKRLAVASEASEEGVFDAAKVKTLTGGETIAARYLFQEWFEFTPRFVLWMAANSLPKVKDRSLGFWRRVVLVPFTRIFQPAERDPSLADRLIAEAPGILQWAFDGLQEYRERGLGVPQCSVAAVEEYRGENDSLADFFDTCIELC